MSPPESAQLAEGLSESGALRRIRRRRLGFRSQQLLIILIAVLPVVAVSALLLLWGARQHQAEVERGLLDTAQALAIAVDRQIVVWQSALEALTPSPAFDDGDFAALYDHAFRVAEQHHGWIVLFDASYQQRLNTLQPYGQPLPRAGSPEQLQRVFDSGKPQVTGLFFGKVAQRWIISIDMPVVRDGRVLYLLDMSFEPTVLTALLESLELPVGWRGVIVDENQKILARSGDGGASVGRSAADWFTQATAARDQGIVAGPSIHPSSEGEDTLVAFSRLSSAPWTVAVAAPSADVSGAWRRQLLILGGLVLGTIGGAAFLAFLYGQRVIAPITALARSADDLLKGRTVASLQPSTIPELEALREALHRAAATARETIITEERVVAAEEYAERLRESEARYRVLFEQVAVGVVHADLSGRWTMVNHRLAEILGFDGPSELAGRTYVEMTHPDDREGDVSFMEALNAGTIPYFRRDKRYLRKDGSPVWVNVTTSLVRDPASSTPLYRVAVVQDITERRRAEERQTLLVNELNHRVRNILGAVQAIVVQGLRGANEDIREHIEARLVALSRSHDLLTRGNWQPAQLSEIVAEAVAPYRGHEEGARFAISGPQVQLPPRLGLALGMALHELATNGAKYGALSSQSGRVEISWGIIGAPQGDRLRIVWCERGGPPVQTPQRKGFGSRLLERGLAREFGGVVRLDYRAEGLVCEIDIAASELANGG